MPANTAKGYPYPLGTDRLMDGDDSIHNLAEAVDSKLGVAAAGYASVPIASGSAQGTVTVTFPAGRFTAAPIMVGMYNGTNVSWSLNYAYSITTTSAIVGATHRDNTPSGSNTTINVMYYAVQLT